MSVRDRTMRAIQSAAKSFHNANDYWWSSEDRVSPDGTCWADYIGEEITRGLVEHDRAVRIAVLEGLPCSYIEHGYAKDCTETISKDRVCRRCAKLRELKDG